MDVRTKAPVTLVEDSESKHGEFDVILSTNALDRDGEELHADEWKTPLPEHITFDSDHGMSVATCVGSGKPFINDAGQLQVRGRFASTPHGQAVRTLIKEGHITSVSVAFSEHKNQKSGKPLRELLNGAFVAVPANPEARVLSAKAAKEDEAEPVTKDAANYIDDQTRAVSDMFQLDPLDADNQPKRKEYWQGVHDVAVKLGAGCPYSDPQATPDVLNGPGNRSVDTGAAVTKSSPPESADEASTDAPLDAAVAGTDDDTDDVVALLGKSLAIRLGLIDL